MAEQSANNRKVILYIEDDASSRELVSRILAYAGYETIVAGSGFEGMTRASERRPDLVLMDINLPDLSGREVTTRLRMLEGFDHVPIIALTAFDHKGEREKALAAGLNGYLTKPVDITELPEQIAGFLEGRQEQLSPDQIAQAHTAYSQEVVQRLELKIRELQTAYDELAKLDKMKDAFIQLTAHELRTPLTLVHGYSRLLHDSPVVGRMMLEVPDVHDLITNLMDASDRMRKVINEILLVARVATGRVELSTGLCTVAEIIDSALAEFHAAIRMRYLELRVDFADDAPQQVYGDQELLRLAVSNMISNAVKFTPDGGRIILRVSLKGDGNLLFTVSDTGIGIHPDERERIFEPFYTSNEVQLHSTSKFAFRGGGLGLGLALCRSIAEAHGGQMWVESAGQDQQEFLGSTFHLSVPLRDMTEEPLFLGLPFLLPDDTPIVAAPDAQAQGAPGVLALGIPPDALSPIPPPEAPLPGPSNGVQGRSIAVEGLQTPGD